MANLSPPPGMITSQRKRGRPRQMPANLPISQRILEQRHTKRLNGEENTSDDEDESFSPSQEELRPPKRGPGRPPCSRYKHRTQSPELGRHHEPGSDQETASSLQKKKRGRPPGSRNFKSKHQPVTIAKEPAGPSKTSLGKRKRDSPDADEVELRTRPGNMDSDSDGSQFIRDDNDSRSEEEDENGDIQTRLP
ncbi:hypothetical protein WAI453_011884 [Rhynchosporium graminicola]